MNENLDLTELLKDCPKGIKLYSPIYGLGILTKVTNRIHVKFPKEHNVKCFRPDGKISEGGEIMLFPKDKTSWEGFQRPFVDGDVIVGEDYIGLYETYRKGNIITYCSIDEKMNFILGEVYCYFGVERFATEEEKQKFFDAIKANGYKWNAEIKILEKLIVPKFKVGDKIKLKDSNIGCVLEISRVYNDSYGLVSCSWMLSMENQNEYELVPNKFDPKTLHPFDKVLCRMDDDDIWGISLFERYIPTNPYPFFCIQDNYNQCIPYNDETIYLLGTTQQVSDKYINW